jgi:hypothetical protein
MVYVVGLRVKYPPAHPVIPAIERSEATEKNSIIIRRGI